MPQFVIVSADSASGRGTRGLNLYWFLKAYHGSAARMMTWADARVTAITCDTLFVGLPTPLRREHFAHLRCRRLVLFDYEDTPQLQLTSDTAYLRELTDTYLKAWTEPQWETHATWRLGVLPIRRQARLPLTLRWTRLKTALGAGAPAREWDASFIGAPTGWDTGGQRVVWLREIAAASPKYRFWGGLASSAGLRRILAERGALADDVLYHDGRVGFLKFFDVMRRSRCVLTPMGNARWSYRHYEAIYAGAIPVSCDMRQANLLIPLPLDGIVHVADGASVLPGIDAGLALSARAEVRESNLAFLEQYLEAGDYSRSRPALWDRFAAQLEAREAVG